MNQNQVDMIVVIMGIYRLCRKYDVSIDEYILFKKSADGLFVKKYCSWKCNTSHNEVRRLYERRLQAYYQNIITISINYYLSFRNEVYSEILCYYRNIIKVPY